MGARAFSEVVKEAKEAGYTEPDPRDDLSGMDVARKVLCYNFLSCSVITPLAPSHFVQENWFNEVKFSCCPEIVLKSDLIIDVHIPLHYGQLVGTPSPG